VKLVHCIRHRRRAQRKHPHCRQGGTPPALLALPHPVLHRSPPRTPRAQLALPHTARLWVGDHDLATGADTRGAGLLCAWCEPGPVAHRGGIYPSPKTPGADPLPCAVPRSDFTPPQRPSGTGPPRRTVDGWVPGSLLPLLFGLRPPLLPGLGEVGRDEVPVHERVEERRHVRRPAPTRAQPSAPVPPAARTPRPQPSPRRAHPAAAAKPPPLKWRARKPRPQRACPQQQRCWARRQPGAWPGKGRCGRGVRGLGTRGRRGEGARTASSGGRRSRPTT
jgi:hypothetical protein